MSQISIGVLAEDELDSYAIIDTTFGDFPSADDWASYRDILEADRCLVARDGTDVVGGVAAVSLHLTVPGGTVPAAGVTGVGVLPTHRRRGLLRSLMERQIGDIHERGEPIAALWSSESGIYGRFGYGVATEHSTFRIDREHTAFAVQVADIGSLRRLEKDEALEVIGDVYERIRPTQTGFMSRSDPVLRMVFHERDEDRRKPLQFVVHAGSDGEPDGYVSYRFAGNWDEATWAPSGTLEVKELLAVTPRANAALWRYIFDVDLAGSTVGALRPASDPLLHLLAEPRRLRRHLIDALWLRLVDVDRALEARSYPGADTLTFGVHDAFFERNNAGITLEATPDGAACHRSPRSPDLALDVATLGAAYLGGARLATFHAAGLIEEHTPGAIARADALLSSPTPPWCPYLF